MNKQNQEHVIRKVESGHYSSPNEVIAKALELLDEYDSKLAGLREGIQAAIEQADNGQLTPAGEVFDRLEKRNAERAT